MKNKKYQMDEKQTIGNKFSLIFSCFIGLLGLYMVPYALKNEILPYLSYPEVVSFYRLANYTVGGVFISLMIVVMSVYLLITGRGNLTKLKGYMLASGYITIFLLILVTIFNFYFTTTLYNKGYGTCWKKSLYSPMLFVKDAKMCEKMGTQVLRKPRVTQQK
ncbi:Protein of uncharacterised function (DUF1240) [Yersinia aldovae]|uniref:DUF1240 domain-containing protein n=1 Tax=Yersinia aldovae TaxID=29483 RepID=UPI0005DAFE10|nr:DUF1240 domain-containing protein [Yersinia aldovae]CNH06956.1 Protein of uncharacterised function (DUF1240) [Yersinia aldovae]